MEHTDATALQAWDSYQRMRARLAARIARELTAASGLSEADYEILGALSRSDAPLRPVALGCDLEWEKSRLSHQLRRMEQRGLITRDTCIEDGRGQEIALTQAGRAAHAKAKTAYDEAVCRYVTKTLSDEQITQLHGIAETVLPHLDD
ncbi:MarR family transcriptional regulator [Microbacterium sp. H1-D42]|uniref:MarR family winged helix-turn-helix transcriptional regulator n=1 Tax=Microbacterium sp. H1-D42 TaxID=2925844 RepID=UPI001F52CC4C|nr:MarR family transcriptional regulator [Microbacterium sp. H1-D42]UNK71161.1 MarR family transcriptional regulator [Microbacterium sp. H1-D42]